ncbi:hypothetical protein HI914_03575 [Erysiphe necator]|nr:hypothetical protein HI914_03575 [Erysiphe necator]
MAIWLKGYKNLIIIAAYNIHHATTANHVLENPDSLLLNYWIEKTNHPILLNNTTQNSNYQVATLIVLRIIKLRYYHGKMKMSSNIQFSHLYSNNYYTPNRAPLRS